MWRVRSFVECLYEQLFVNYTGVIHRSAHPGFSAPPPLSHPLRTVGSIEFVPIESETPQ